MQKTVPTDGRLDLWRGVAEESDILLLLQFLILMEMTNRKLSQLVTIRSLSTTSIACPEAESTHAPPIHILCISLPPSLQLDLLDA